jgi:hypothetical protein
MDRLILAVALSMLPLHDLPMPMRPGAKSPPAPRVTEWRLHCLLVQVCGVLVPITGRLWDGSVVVPQGPQMAPTQVRS